MDPIDRRLVQMMKPLLISTAVLEVGAGSALLCCPSLMGELLLRSSLDTAAVTLGRVGGTALLALGVACWLAQFDAQSAAARGVVTAMTVYNFGVFAVLGIAGVRAQATGIALWPAVALHVAMTIWCVTCLRERPLPDSTTTT